MYTSATLPPLYRALVQHMCWNTNITFALIRARCESNSRVDDMRMVNAELEMEIAAGSTFQFTMLMMSAWNKKAFIASKQEGMLCGLDVDRFCPDMVHGCNVELL